jgi:hypothetical protein
MFIQWSSFPVVRRQQGKINHFIRHTIEFTQVIDYYSAPYNPENKTQAQNKNI